MSPVTKKGEREMYVRLLIVNVLFFAIVGVVIWNVHRNQAAQEASLPFAPATANVTSTSTSTPVRLIIPSIGVNAKVQLVGKTKSGNMAVPNNFTDVGWYRLGYYPGTIGNAVIAGHLDNGPKVPAVFWHLADLKIGDDVQVKTEAGNVLHFRVVAESLYDYNNAPLGFIFGTSTASHLNLITCDGVWDPAKRLYDKRLIVFTDFVSEDAIATSTKL